MKGDLRMTAKIAVSAAVFAIDKPYSYKIPENLAVQPGMRVLVPFGRGNRRCEGMVLSVEAEQTPELKTIERVLDDAPVLSPEQLRLAAFVRERYFCTYYDAVKAILPAGLWFQTREQYTLVSAQDGAAEEKNEMARAVLQAIEAFGGSASYRALKDQFEDEQALCAALKLLVGKKRLTTEVELHARTGGKTERMAELSAPAEEAVAFAARKQRSAPQQAAVLNLMCAIGSGSCREICALTGASAQTLRRLEQLGYLQITEREVLRTPAYTPAAQEEAPALSSRQQSVFEGLLQQMQREKPGAALLYGVTGSGKTSVYIRLIYAALSRGKAAVLLVPEIALTPQLLGKLRAHFGRQVAVLHSSLRVGERFDEWRRIKDGDAHVVVGTRSAIFAPVGNPGIFIIDEEQEHTYKSENAPRYHAREIALYRGLQSGALVLLGSATPSVESMYHAQNGDYTLYTLTERYNGRALPAVEIVDMKQELRAGNATSISRALEERIRDNVIDGRQSILFLNRRGNSRLLMCVECGEAPVCPRCSVHLTYHSVTQRLMCHYCGYSEPVYARCKCCGGALKPVGAGTQKVEQELRDVFPDTALLRMDADTVSASNSHEAILSRFQQQRIPILLGTQMVAKGLDFENVTLVGVLDADMSLYLDHYRAAETTFSLLTQVVGRAGRGEAAGTAMIQTMTPEHPVIKLAAKQDYDAFYDLEIGLRSLRGVPPFADLFTITFTGAFEEQVMRAAARFRDMLRACLRREPYCAEKTQLLGPAPAAIAKINYTWRYRLTLSAKNSRPLRQLISFCLCEFAKDRQNRGVNAFADVNSYD